MYKNVRKQLSQPNAQRAARAGVDFAQKIWDGEVNDATVLQLLADRNGDVRAMVAWAIADAHRPKAGADWLLSHGLGDSHELVRYWTARLILESDDEVLARMVNAVMELNNDPSKDVQRTVREIISRWRQRVGDPGKVGRQG